MVDAVDLGAIDLARLMQALHGLAGDGPVLGILERGLLRRLQLGGGVGHLAIGDGAVGGLVADHALGDRALGDRNLPLIGRRLHKHHAGRCAALAHIDGGLSDALAASGAEIAPDALAGEILAGGGIFGGDLGPVSLELLGDELGEAGEGALAHLHAGDADHDRIVRLDDDPGVDLGRQALGRSLVGEGNGEAERQAAGGCTGADKEIAAGKINGVHGWTLP